MIEIILQCKLKTKINVYLAQNAKRKKRVKKQNRTWIFWTKLDQLGSRKTKLVEHTNKTFDWSWVKFYWTSCTMPIWSKWTGQWNTLWQPHWLSDTTARDNHTNFNCNNVCKSFIENDERRRSKWMSDLVVIKTFTVNLFGVRNE